MRLLFLELPHRASPSSAWPLGKRFITAPDSQRAPSQTQTGEHQHAAETAPLRRQEHLMAPLSGASTSSQGPAETCYKLSRLEPWEMSGHRLRWEVDGKTAALARFALASNCPPWLSTIHLLMASPSPVPPAARERSLLVR